MAQCGYQTGVVFDDTRPSWQERGARPLAWSAWYPTEARKGGDPPAGAFFRLGNVIPDAVVSADQSLPVVLLSHGTGGTAESLGWLARPLARAGYVVIGANHHDNTGGEPYQAAGFLCWWERATDLSLLLTCLAGKGPFADKLDLRRVSAIGFSLGGHTVLALAGARTALPLFEGWQRGSGRPARGPKEFPDAAEHIPVLLQTSETFRQSWARHGDNYADGRVGSVIAIAPAPPIRSLMPQSLARLEVPVTLLSGAADVEAPIPECAAWLIRQNTRFQHVDLGAHVGHETFLECPSDRKMIGRVDLFTDHESVNRRQVHHVAVGIIRRALLSVRS